MEQRKFSQHDFGTGEKKLNIYATGIIACIILTLLSFWIVILHELTKPQIIMVIFISACAQFFVQVFCFIRLNTETKQGRTNIMVLLFTFAILFCIVMGSLWTMWNLQYNMM